MGCVEEELYQLDSVFVSSSLFIHNDLSIVLDVCRRTKDKRGTS